MENQEERRKYKYEMKPALEARLRKLLPDETDFREFEKVIHTGPRSFVRCNTLKISPQELFERLNKKWKVVQPFTDHKEIMLVEQNLLPGELGNSIEHLLGYYYIQEIVSMLPPLALDPQPGEFVLDLFASPGSKTTQMAAKMKNQGTLIANDLKIDRIRILASNLEKSGATNIIVTRNDAVNFCQKLEKTNFKFDKILCDAPCSGEGTIRSSPKTLIMWNEKVIKNFGRQQRKFIACAIKLLKKGGTLVYSTCTHAPEENESVVDFVLKNFPVKIETLSLPIVCRSGITEWEGDSFSQEVKKACRIYPHDNDSEGFFLAKFTLLEEIE